jgi:hypothetical protein
MTMLMRHLWPSRPTFQSATHDFDQVRRDMMRAFDALHRESADDDAAAGVFPTAEASVLQSLFGRSDAKLVD